jgi:hypothetical protein
MKRRSSTGYDKRDLYRLRGVWIEQVYEDEIIKKASVFKIAFAIYRCMTMKETATEYSKKGRIYIWPKQKWIADDARLSEDTVGAGLAELVERGYLKLVRHGNQFSGSSKYRVMAERAA